METETRINDLARIGRNAWLVLLSAVIFSGVTLMGVRDVHLFVPNQETVLPLVGVSVPTLLFFYTAPLLITALYANLHFHLLKLWEVTAAIPQAPNRRPLSDKLAASFITDYALAARGDGALRPRPLAWATRAFTAILIFTTAPGILFAFWWESLARHDEILSSIFCGLPLAFCLFAGWSSWRHLQRQIKGTRPRFVLFKELTLLTYIAAPILTYGSFATAGRLYHALLNSGTITDITRTNRNNFPHIFLAKADLSNEVLVETPPDWLPYEEARAAYNSAFCKQNDMPSRLCDDRYDGENQVFRTDQRLAWCAAAFGTERGGETCTRYFTILDRQRAEGWQTSYDRTITSLPKVNLTRVDLRGANLADAVLPGADLLGAKMQGASLRSAQMQGAELGGAQMQKAVLSYAQLERASLRFAQIQGAILVDAQMRAANLEHANIEGANLLGAQMQGANLVEVKMQGANLNLAKMQEANLNRANLQGAYLWGADLSNSLHLINADILGVQLRHVKVQNWSISQDQVNMAFGDGSVDLTGSDLTRPAHWSSTELHLYDYQTEFVRWIEEGAAYIPPKDR